jgi:nucleoporin NUP42
MDTAITSVLNDIEGAITYIIEGREDHPNRIDVLKQFAPKIHAPRGGRGGRGGDRGNFNSGRQDNQFQSAGFNNGGGFPQAQQSTGFGQPTNGFGDGFADQITGFGHQNDSMMMSPTIDQAPTGFGQPSNGFGQPVNNGFGGSSIQQSGGFGMPEPQQQQQPQQQQNGGGFSAPVGTIPGEASMDDPPMAMFGLDEQEYQQAYQQAKQQGNFGEGIGMPFMSPKQAW